MSDPDHGDNPAARLRAIEDAIARARERRTPRSAVEDHHSQGQLAWRMVIELVAGLGIGFGIGYGLDVLAGTRPVFMVLFIFAGLAAGIRTMLRSAQEVQAKRMAADQGPAAGTQGDDASG